jgi:60 kDa SS-A/Ro ribonucleoprotein
MSKFNTATLSRKGSAKTINYAGGEAYTMSAKTEFVSILLTSFVTDQYYRSADDGIARVIELLDQVPAQFAAKASIYARNEFGMRSVSHMVAAELAHRTKGEQWTKDYYSAVVRRPDDMTEILAYYLSKFGKPVPNSLKKGFAKAFDKFDGYQLGKYRGEGKAISLVDVVNIVRPRSMPKNAKALKLLTDDKLRSSETWEAKVSAAGASGEKKADAWRELLMERKIGYFALLRNLRNIEEQAPDLVPAAAEMLVDEDLIRGSLVLPFRFLTAREQVANPKLISAMSRALDISLDNVPAFDNSLVVVDHSGSMRGPVAQSTMSCQFLGDLFGAALFKKNHSDVMVFGFDAGYVTGLNPEDSTLSLAEKIGNVHFGHSTNFQSIFDRASKAYDRIVIFSDMQAWDTYYAPDVSGYKSRTKANPFLYSFDLAGYGTLQFPADRTFALSGFSEKTFGLMALLESDKAAMVHAVEAVSF